MVLVNLVLSWIESEDLERMIWDLKSRIDHAKKEADERTRKQNRVNKYS